MILGHSTNFIAGDAVADKKPGGAAN